MALSVCVMGAKGSLSGGGFSMADNHGGSELPPQRVRWNLQNCEMGFGVAKFGTTYDVPPFGQVGIAPVHQRLWKCYSKMKPVGTVPATGQKQNAMPWRRGWKVVPLLTPS
jgi:hypothetical protein